MLLLPGHLALAVKEVGLVDGRGLKSSYAPCMHCKSLEPSCVGKETCWQVLQCSATCRDQVES